MWKDSPFACVSTKRINWNEKLAATSKASSKAVHFGSAIFRSEIGRKEFTLVNG